MRDHFDSRYKEPCIQRPIKNAFSKQETKETIENENYNIRSLLLQQPKNVESECKFHSDLFSKLKFNFIQSSWKLAFVNKLLQVPAEFPNAMDLEGMESKTSFHKATLQENKALAMKLRNEIDAFIQEAYSAFIKGQGLYSENMELLDKVKQLELDLGSLPFPPTNGSPNETVSMNSPNETQKENEKEKENQISQYKSEIESNVSNRSYNI